MLVSDEIESKGEKLREETGSDGGESKSNSFNLSDMMF